MKKVQSKLHPTEIGVIKTFSLSPDDEVGEIAVECSGCIYYYNNLRELCEKWEDYEEPPKMAWYIWNGEVQSASIDNDWAREKAIGNYFETKEEAERAVEKLKAWKRLKDKGFRFEGYDNISSISRWRFELVDSSEYEVQKDLDLLFGGEE